MFPKTASGVHKHRRAKRVREVTLATEAVAEYADRRDMPNGMKTKVLEIGSGDGFQIPYLRQFGDVVVSDIYVSDDVNAMNDVDFVRCSITEAPFPDESFDLIFSNHVIEHIEDLETGFDEMRRIGKPGCIYAHAVPNNTWLLLSVPFQYYDKLRVGIRRLLSRRDDTNTHTEDHYGESASGSGAASAGRRPRLARYLFPGGHGVYQGFLKCYREFRTGSWEKTFTDNGFELLKSEPLLLYGPSEWPVIPTTDAFRRINLCSSVLFIMRKADS